MIKVIHESDKKRNSFFIFIAVALISIAFLASLFVVFNPLEKNFMLFFDKNSFKSSFNYFLMP